RHIDGDAMASFGVALVAHQQVNHLFVAKDTGIHLKTPLLPDKMHATVKPAKGHLPACHPLEICNPYAKAKTRVWTAWTVAAGRPAVGGAPGGRDTFTKTVTGARRCTPPPLPKRPYPG